MRVAVAADQALIREAVRTALHARGETVLPLRWPDTDRPRAVRPEVGLLISELDRWDILESARTVMTALPVPWVVLTECERGGRWGALVETGARAFLPIDTPLAAVDETLRAVEGGADLLGAGAEPLQRAWEQLREEHAELTARLASLTPRELTVLRLLYDGNPVNRIAETLAIAPATVRSQVKAIRHKLVVRSQLAAVAAYRHLVELDGAPPTVRLPRPRRPGGADRSTPATRPTRPGQVRS
ncbi:helix-turn-helix transcriptional regulator [Nocardioides insulae]|uniref:helix-turn-helix transcriptional regulator n=1 Tax=Nocardioides insulae TaxID=394734 RepID=UPI0004299E7E|nr:LuxR C-terminal-related transcriptional regulator [Nocardioides insulae]